MAHARRLTVDEQMLLRLRRGLRLSQEQAAASAGLTALTVRKLEKGQQLDLRLATLGRLAETYQVEPCSLLTWR